MTLPKIIGITGGIGSGKTTVASMLKSFGYHVYDTDFEARRLQNEHDGIINKTKELFGEEIYTEDGLDRKAVARLVFSDSDLLTKLNKIVHPVIEENIKQWIANNNSDEYLFVESAILIECGFNKYVDRVLLVMASEEVRIQRVMKRDGVTYEQVKSRIGHQMSDDAKIPLADYIIRTDDETPLVDKLRTFIASL
jgi:dephospho-CoA kinase